MDGRSCGCRTLSRRRFLGLAGAAAVLPVGLGGCDDGDWPVDLVSDETVARMGQASWQSLLREVPLSRDAAQVAALEDVAGRLLRAAGQPVEAWDVRVFQGAEVNAFALPGGKIGVFEGMMHFAGSPAQLAAVVGHEIGHVTAEHSQERLNAAVVKDLGMDAVRLFLDLGEVAYAPEIAALLGLGAEVGLTLPYSRAHELESDRIGLTLMRQAGYDPQQAVTLWRRMAQRDDGGFAFLSTHPAPTDRARRLGELIADGTRG